MARKHPRPTSHHRRSRHVWPQLRRWATSGLCLAALAQPLELQPRNLCAAMLRPPAEADDDSAALQGANPLEARLLADLRDLALDEFSLWEAALVAEGTADRDALARYRQRLAGWQADLSPRLAGTSAPLERARIVHAFLHTEVLRGGFAADCSRLETLCADGRYNCLSSTIAFLTLARSAGVSAEAVAEPAHVYCQLTVCQPPEEVQTTDQGWFDAAAHTPRPGPRRAVSDATLVALVYYNQGVSRLASGDFEAAARANSIACRLDPQLTQARNNLLAAYNNWAVASGSAGRFEEAIGIFERGLTAAPQHLPLRKNLITLYRRWAHEHQQAGRWREAQRILDRGLEQFPGDADLLRAREQTR